MSNEGDGGSKKEDGGDNLSSRSSSSIPWRSCFRPDLFRGKVALVTGGGTGIGLAIAKEIAILGGTVVIASRDESKCQLTAAEVNATLPSRTTTDQGAVGGKMYAGPSTSIRSEEQIQNLISHVISTYGGLHLLVNNAGGQFVSEAADISRRGFAAVVETNLLGTFLVCREAYNQYMRDNGGGSIVNITLGNRNGMPHMVHSGAARAGVENMSITLSSEWMESNVRVNCVRPGIIWTESGFQNYGPLGDAFLGKIVPSLPAKRLGTPEEISSAVSWLLSEGASYVTGAVVCVDGGSSFHFLPLMDMVEEAHLLPSYGTLPDRAKL